MNGFDHNSGGHLLIGDANIYYEMKGNLQGPALVFIHGGFGNMEDFNIVLEDLLPHYKIIGIDSRGQGMSTLGSAELTYERIQEDVHKILDHLDIPSTSLIGFSDGGIVAYRLAVQQTIKIEKLVTISSRWHINDALLTKEEFLEITPDSYRKSFPEAYDNYQRLNPEPDFDKLVPLLVKMWLDAGASAYLNEEVKSISHPLLIAHGDDDHLLTKESVVKLSILIKGSHLLNIPYAEHFAFRDQPEVFKIVMKQFFGL